jgi:hypothetical protein
VAEEEGAANLTPSDWPIVRVMVRVRFGVKVGVKVRNLISAKF